MPRSLVLPEIEQIDPLRDHQRIVLLSARCDFPFDTTRALELALFRTFAVPGVSALLDKTGEFFRRTQLRYDDTDLLVSEMMEHGYDSERGRAAQRRMNQIHARFDIPNDLYLYVLSTFVFEPIRWNARFGWRRQTETERLAFFCFWREVGRRMGIKDIHDTYEAFERFNVEFERDRFAFADTNRRVAESTLRMMCGWFPRPLRRWVRKGMIAVMDEPLRKAVGMEVISPRFARVVEAALKARATVLRHLPRRKAPLLRTGMRHRSHPGGYAIGKLGPPMRA
jgi:hypothetical protein